MNSNNDGRKDPGLARKEVLSDFVGHPLYQPLMDAIRQAMYGKGERHGGATVPFREQPIFHYAKMHGRGFLTGQAAKKLEEAADRLKGQAFVDEVLGAIVYAGAAILAERDAMFVESVKVKVAGGAMAAGVVGAAAQFAHPEGAYQAYAEARGGQVQAQIQAQGHDGPGGLILRNGPSPQELADKEASLQRHAEGRNVQEQDQRAKWAGNHDAARANAGL